MSLIQSYFYSDIIGGSGSENQNLNWPEFASLALAQASPAWFVKVSGKPYYRSAAGATLKPFLDGDNLTAINNAIASGDTAVTDALTLALQTAINAVETKIAAVNRFAKKWDASESGAPLPTTRTDGSALKEGDGILVTVGGTVGGVIYKTGDVFFAKVDSPTTATDFGDVMAGGDTASYSLAGIVKVIETEAQLNAASANGDLANVVTAGVLLAKLATMQSAITQAIADGDATVTTAFNSAIGTLNTDLLSAIATAKGEAIATAASDATTKAAAAKTDAITAAATDATAKADAAKMQAITAAATDATTKADAAVVAAQTYADATFATKLHRSVSQVKKDGTNVVINEFDDLASVTTAILGSASYASSDDEIRLEKKITVGTTQGQCADFYGNNNDIELTAARLFQDALLPADFPSKSLEVRNVNKINWSAPSATCLFRYSKAGKSNVIEVKEIASVNNNGQLIGYSGVGSSCVMEVGKAVLNYSGWNPCVAAWDSAFLLVKDSDITNFGSFLAQAKGLGTVHFRNCIIRAKANASWGYDTVACGVEAGSKMIFENCVIENDGHRAISVAGVVEFRGSNIIKSNGITNTVLGIVALAQPSDASKDNFNLVHLQNAGKLVNFGNLVLQGSVDSRFAISSAYQEGASGVLNVISAANATGIVENYGTITANKPLDSSRISIGGGVAYINSSLSV